MAAKLLSSKRSDVGMKARVVLSLVSILTLVVSAIGFFVLAFATFAYPEAVPPGTAYLIAFSGLGMALFIEAGRKLEQLYAVILKETPKEK